MAGPNGFRLVVSLAAPTLAVAAAAAAAQVWVDGGEANGIIWFHMGRERHEIPLAFDPVWFGGVVEAACTAIFTVGEDVREGKTYTKVTPVIAMKDNNWGRVTRLAVHAGGIASRINFAGSSPYQWTARGYYAVELSRYVKPYAPSREETFIAFENWAETENQEEREEIARDLQETRGGRVEVSQDQYRVLVTRKNFVAGVIDARGDMYSKIVPYTGDRLPYHDWAFPEMRVYSKKQPLLAALHEQWGGVIRSGGWYLGKETGLELFVESIAPELKLRSTEPTR